MTTEQVETLKREVAKRNKFNRYVVSGNAHTGKYRFILFNLAFGKMFLTGTNDNTSQYTINAVQWETISSIKAVDWNVETKEEVFTKII